jgi:hypothetical protein
VYIYLGSKKKLFIYDGVYKELVINVRYVYKGNGYGGTRTDTSSTTTTTNTANGLPRSPFAFTFGRNNSSEFTSPLASTPLADRVASGLPFPVIIVVFLLCVVGLQKKKKESVTFFIILYYSQALKLD